MKKGIVGTFLFVFCFTLSMNAQRPAQEPQSVSVEKKLDRALSIENGKAVIEPNTELSRKNTPTINFKADPATARTAARNARKGEAPKPTRPFRPGTRVKQN